MVQKSGQLTSWGKGTVVYPIYPIIFRVLYIQTVVGNGISEPSTVAENWQRGHPPKGNKIIFQALILRGQKLAVSF